MIFSKQRFKNKVISSLLTLVLFAGFIPFDKAFGYVSEVDYPKKVDSFASSNNFKDEVLSCKITKSGKLLITYQTPLHTDQFNISLYRVGENKGDVNLNILAEPLISTSSSGNTIYGFESKINPEDLTVPYGKYNLYIKRGTLDSNTGEMDYAPNSILYKNMELKFDTNGFKILRYNQVIDTNNEIRLRGDAYPVEKYLDNTLEDIRFVLRDPATNAFDTMSESKIAYMKSISDKVCQNAFSDYDKLVKIYEYTAGNFYYDTIAFKEHKLQYANPYNNVYSFENHSSAPNAQDGKVATTCQGFAAIFLAFARAQNIPTRFVYGHRLAVPSNDWITESGIDVLDHWWLECLVNGRWIFVDPTVGTTSKYNKNSGIWQYSGVTNYTYFDPSKDQIATSHVYMNIFPDYRRHIFLENDYEKEAISNFLEYTGSASLNYEDDFGYFSYGKSNGSLLNKEYTVFDLATWGDKKYSNFRLDGRGNVAQIIWRNRDLQGEVNFTNFKSLNFLNLSGNNLTKADLSNNTALNKVYLSSNGLINVNLLDSGALNLADLRDNPLKELSIKIKGKNRFFAAEEHGTFAFYYQNRYWGYTSTIYAKPDIGYKVKGIYDGSSQKITRKKIYHFIPTKRDYTIKFTLNPYSYKYFIGLNESAKSKLRHIKAAAERLSELGYYTGDIDKITSFDSTLSEAAVRFQVVNDLLNTGNIDKPTWHKLFNTEAQAMPDSATYSNILSEYEATKAEKILIKDNIGKLNIDLDGKLTNKRPELTWEAMIGSINNGSVSDTENTNNLAETGFSIDANSIISNLDGFYIYRSTSKDYGFKRIKTVSGTTRSFTDKAKLKPNTNYYYKVVAFKTVFGQEYTSNTSNVIRCKTPKSKEETKK